MAYAIEVTLRIHWVPEGAGSAFLGSNQSNHPGYGSSLGPGAVQAAQTLELRQAEQVPGGSAPTQANFNTAMTSAATDLATQMGTAGAYSGGTQTPLAIAQGWSTGQP